MKRQPEEPVGDRLLDERLARYDTWLREGQLTSTSKVIPVEQSIEARQWVLPGSQALALIRKAGAVALTTCECREHYQRCSGPLDVCLILDDAAEKWVLEGRARYVTLDEAAAALRRADEHGLVHLAIYRPGEEVYAVCSCCSCCCHELQFLRLYGRRDLIARSEYEATTSESDCTDCGACVERCVFGAREMLDGRLVYRSDGCYGCGLCVTVCATGATEMARRTE